jgi:hypothetical protein
MPARQVSRRTFAAVVTLAATTGACQAQPQAAPQAPGRPNGELAEARARNLWRTQALMSVEIPISTEPAFVFQA